MLAEDVAQRSGEDALADAFAALQDNGDFALLGWELDEAGRPVQHELVQ